LHKLDTYLSYFKYDSVNRCGPVSVTWYKLVLNEQKEEVAVCFSYQELTTFQQFINGCPLNFPGAKNYRNCNNEDGDLPYCSVNQFNVTRRNNSPKNLILRKIPRRNVAHFFGCVDITLTNLTGHSIHNYNLNFDVIGLINMEIV